MCRTSREASVDSTRSQTLKLQTQWSLCCCSNIHCAAGHAGGPGTDGTWAMLLMATAHDCMCITWLGWPPLSWTVTTEGPTPPYPDRQGWSLSVEVKEIVVELFRYIFFPLQWLSVAKLGAVVPDPGRTGRTLRSEEWLQCWYF